jgi:hypothetical protein
MTDATMTGALAGEGASQVPDDPTQGEGQGNSPESARSTLLTTLRAKRDALKADHYLDLDIPGYDGLLVARFRPFPIEKSEAKAKQLQKLQAANAPVLLKSACDTLVDACEQLMVRTETGGEPKPIDPDADLPIAFDSRAAEMFGFQATTARQVVIGLFGTEQSIVAMSVEVSRWMTTLKRETDEDLLGNS